MNLVLRGLQDRGLVTRPSTAPRGRTLPTELTASGRRRLRVAGVAVRQVEEQMVSPLSPTSQRRLRADLPPARRRCHRLRSSAVGGATAAGRDHAEGQ